MSIACGDEHTLTLDDNGCVWIIGDKNGRNYNSKGYEVIRKIDILCNIAGISCGALHSLCVDSNGDVWAFGDNKKGQLGFGDTNTRYIPEKIPKLSSVSSVHCGPFQSFCIFFDNTACGFGNNDYGLLGLGEVSECELFPKLIPNLSDIKDIASGEFHSVFLLFDGTLRLSGDNLLGQLGLGLTEFVCIPCTMPLNDINIIACGATHTLIVTNSGDIYGFGSNRSGCLGIGNREKQFRPVKLEFEGTVKSICCGRDYTLILNDDGMLWGFGKNGYSYCLGLPQKVDRLIPEKLHSGVVLVATGSGHSFIKFYNGKISSFGCDTENQCGFENYNYNTTDYARTLPDYHSHIVGSIFQGSKQKSAKSNIAFQSS